MLNNVHKPGWRKGISRIQQTRVETRSCRHRPGRGGQAEEFGKGEYWLHELLDQEEDQGCQVLPMPGVLSHFEEVRGNISFKKDRSAGCNKCGEAACKSAASCFLCKAAEAKVVNHIAGLGEDGVFQTALKEAKKSLGQCSRGWADRCQKESVMEESQTDRKGKINAKSYSEYGSDGSSKERVFSEVTIATTVSRHFSPTVPRSRSKSPIRFRTRLHKGFYSWPMRKK